MSTILIKIGGSIITKKGSSPIHVRAINQHACEFKGTQHKVVIVHGTGHVGKPPALKFGYIHTKHLPAKKIRKALSIRSQIINFSRKIEHCFTELGIPVLLIDNTHFFSHRKNRWHNDNLIELISSLTKTGIIPIFSGNFILTKKGEFNVLSSDELMLILARLIHPQRVIFFSDVDGVLDHDMNVIPIFDRTMLKNIDSSPDDVSGGMETKIKTTLKLNALCKDCFIANGTKKGILKDFLMKDKSFGTKISFA